MNKGKIDKNTYNLIKQEKEIFKYCRRQFKKYISRKNTYSLEKLNKYCEEWKENYKTKNYDEKKKFK